ncbi:GNAT family N-acetyltransferase [Colwellia sp. BRX10-6]|uniref:GNAT family N-acetyltransferase n=1 Tax=unclassified Colwellia TaxID=196834 RepID=UPI0015F68BC4|nr:MULTISPECIES: GNAT family N-acetyltransferase [unclassified Colwellia]MBA6385186.1 GNAT family N-acetyltransferase [Colwellia sp. BRX10-9]MBA6396028.1 GNAT family N-acetyltransferase [Colwellia sp. BRX10-6]
MKVQPDFFLESIFKFEAQRMLRDILSFTFMKSSLNELNEDKKLAAINYIIDILKECHSVGDLEVLIENEDRKLKGYGLLFLFPDINATYLHSIFIVEQYRKKGLGTKLLNKIKDLKFGAHLICDNSKISYYEQNGFRYVEPVQAPKGDDFKISKNLYRGLSIMTSSKSAIGSPIFFLNDQDLNTIAGLK